MSKINFTESLLRVIISLIGLPFTWIQAALSRYLLYKYKAPGEKISVGSHHLHAMVTGSNTSNLPTILLEAGMGGCALDWSLVQPALAKHTKVLSYDRAGFGWSTKPISEPTCEGYVRDLRELLTQLELEPPYILVGHSYGGMIMRLFASKYPEEVSGIILVDSTHEQRFIESTFNQIRYEERLRHLRRLRMGYLLSPIGLPRLLKQPIGAKRLPPPVQHTVNTLGYRNNAYKAAYLESLCTIESALQLVESEPLIPELPIIVLSAGRQNEDWQQAQKKLLQLTAKTRQIVIENSWHSIQLYNPQAVVDSVLSLLRDNHRNQTDKLTSM
ncbi:alpha/beta hydrolase [Paenibacillus sp. FSL R7-0204]|uniref:alpha/beta hydrolase n=1 Tax=Paenibacillus sp. FSL R7-0204 TaxID=2921675 RepID=UPI0030F825CA